MTLFTVAALSGAVGSHLLARHAFLVRVLVVILAHDAPTPHLAPRLVEPRSAPDLPASQTCVVKYWLYVHEKSPAAEQEIKGCHTCA